MNGVKAFQVILGVLALSILVSALLSLPVMWLWNYLMPELFGLKTINWFQSWCLLMLTGFLFRSSYTSATRD